MLPQSFDDRPVSPAAGERTAAFLIARAVAALDQDIGAARTYLNELEGLIAGMTASGQPGRRQSKDEGGRPGFPRGGLAPWQARRVIRHIEENLSQSIVLDDLAGIARLSNSHFCRSFKTTMGDTPHRFIMRKRVERAQALMLATRHPLSQIACDCGLTDQAHLTRLFHKFVGETPLGWRRAWQRAE